MPGDYIVSAEHVSKSFGSVTALKDISFDVMKGEIFGFIGPDGSGKTTLFRIITTLLVPDAGKVTVSGFDCVKDYREIRRSVGYMPGRFSLYMDLTVEENLEFYAAVFGTTVKENYDLIEGIYSQIEPFKKRLAGKLSGGMKQKLALSCALIHKPELIILDEPTTGVDAVARAEFWEILHNLREHNITIIASTPYMDEAMRCDRVALIQEGRILSVDLPEMIKAGFTRKLFSVTAKEKFKLIRALRNHPETATAYPFGESVHVTFKNNEAPGRSFYDYLASTGITDITITETQPGIEDRFLELMEK